MLAAFSESFGVNESGEAFFTIQTVELQIVSSLRSLGGDRIGAAD